MNITSCEERYINARGYLEGSNTCPDCGVVAAPAVQIEHLHQKLLKRFVEEQNAAPGTSVNIPMGMMAILRCSAIEQYLENKHIADTNAAPIVRLQ